MGVTMKFCLLSRAQTEFLPSGYKNNPETPYNMALLLMHNQDFSHLEEHKTKMHCNIKAVSTADLQIAFLREILPTDHLCFLYFY